MSDADIFLRRSADERVPGLHVTDILLVPQGPDGGEPPDTTPPSITWGGVSGAQPGDTLIVGYVLDEPAAISATIEFADARVEPMLVGPAELQVDVPEDAAYGVATVRLLVRDAAGNEAIHELEIVFRAPDVQPPTPGAAGGLPGRALEPDRIIRTRTVVRIRSKTRIRVRRISRRPQPIVAATHVAASMRGCSWTGTNTRTALSATVEDNRRQSVCATTGISRRDDDLEAMAALGLF